MYRIGFVGCVKRKRESKCQAKDLYISDLFVKARKYVERRYDKWFILSAKYHLVEPETIIEPYDETLNEKGIEERREWARIVFNQIRQRFPDPSLYKLYFHAGMRYREFLIPLLNRAKYSCEVPLEGLKIGEQLSWYKRHLT